MTNKTYTYLDSGNLKRLEKFDDVILERPCFQAVWQKSNPKLWNDISASFTRDKKEGWSFRKKVPESWNVHLDGITLKLTPTDFGHLGVFPEHREHFPFMLEKIKERKHPKVLNLFAYTGLASLYLAKHGAHVTHLDASKKAVAWAKENAKLSGLEQAPIRYITEDVLKFLKREVRRGSKYDAILLDPPSFGRGTKNEVFVIEEHLCEMMSLCKELLTKEPLFLLLTCHTPGYTGIVLQNVLKQILGSSFKYESGEMLLHNETNTPLSSGSYVRATHA